MSKRKLVRRGTKMSHESEVEMSGKPTLPKVVCPACGWVPPRPKDVDPTAACPGCGGTIGMTDWLMKTLAGPAHCPWCQKRIIDLEFAIDPDFLPPLTCAKCHHELMID